jgi:hypothetical protein
MSSVSHPTDAAAPVRSTPANAATEARDRTLRRAALAVSVVVLIWSFLEVVSLATRHTAGPELYGVLVAVLATGAGVANVVLLRSPRARALVIVAVLVVWAVVALGGIAGTVAHVVGPPISEGPVDPRPRPVPAPLVFTLLGLAGGAALLLGQRATFRSLGRSRKESF